MPEARASKMSI
jgi:hypothetical protein